MAAAEAGAKQLHTCVNGIGERAGNAALEEVLMGLAIHYGMDRYNTSNLKSLSKVVESYSGIPVAKNKSVVGENAFAHESGIHIAALLENDRTYELFSPETVGGKREFILGKHSGSKALCYMARQLGFTLTAGETDLVLSEIKRMGDNKQSLRKDELAELIAKVLAKDNEMMSEQA
jgi:methanogen homocitrate synthase